MKFERLRWLLAASVIAVAGCAGGSTTYAVEPTAACLLALPGSTVYRDKEALDIVAAAAPAGALRADFPAEEREAYVAFGRAVCPSRGRERSARSFAAVFIVNGLRGLGRCWVGG